MDDFRRLLLTEDEELFAAVGRQDFGLLYGPVPRVPEVARPDLLGRVEALVTPSAEDSGSVPVCVITGLSGLGKSSLAAAYVAEHAFRYDAVFWVEAETEEALISSFARVLGHLTGAGEPVEVTDPRLLRERVHAQLQSLPGPWLMVLDDATARTARAWVPRRGRGAVVVTSLGGNWREARGLVELGAMRGDQAVELTRLRLGLSDSEAAQHAETVEHLTQTLECWPLAIEVACGYLVSCRVGSPHPGRRRRTQCGTTGGQRPHQGSRGTHTGRSGGSVPAGSASCTRSPGSGVRTRRHRSAAAVSGPAGVRRGRASGPGGVP